MIERRWVIDSSPLILLGKIGQLGLLPRMTVELIIPQGVAKEIALGAQEDAARQWVATQAHRWICDTEATHPLVAPWNLGPGENEVLSFAVENRGYTVVIDDLAARSCAVSLQLPMQGTLGILLLAKKDGHIQQIRPLINSLQDAGMRLAPAVIEQVLELATE